MSANFEQISGPQGRVQTLVPSSAVQTFLFNPQSLKGMLPGGDYVYCDRLRARITGNLVRTEAGALFTPNWQILAQMFRNVRVFSPFLGEMVNKSINSVPLLANHDAMMQNGFQAYTRERAIASASVTSSTIPIEYEFPIYFQRNYLTRPEDSSPWMGFLEGGIVEIDLGPSNSLEGYGWTMSGNFTCELVADWSADRQPFIHAPVQSRLYRVVTTGPEYTLKSVGATQGYDGIVKGCRLAVLSWLGVGDSADEDQHDNGFYNSFQAGGISFGQTANPGAANVTRMDVPWRDQRSIDAVSAWVSSFLGETVAIRHWPTIAAADASTPTTQQQNDFQGWPYVRNPSLFPQAYQSLINAGLDFFPLIWPYDGQKIVDIQKVDGDLSFTANLQDPPDESTLHLFRTDEVCAFTKSKAMDLMERMGMTHVERGGQFIYVPKYAGLRAAGESTQWGLPLKIIPARAPKK